VEEMIDRKVREMALDTIINKETKYAKKKKVRVDKLLKRYAKKMEQGHNNGDIGGSYSYFLDFDYEYMREQLIKKYGGAIKLDSVYTGTEFKVTFFPTIEYREEELK